LRYQEFCESLIELAFQSPRITSVRSSARHENQVS